MRRELVSKAEFSARAGVSPTAITKACKPGGALSKATVGEGRKMRVDINHPAAVQYVESKLPDVQVSVDGGESVPLDEYLEKPTPYPPTRSTGAGAAKETRKRSSANDIDPAGIPDNMQDFADMTIRDVVSKFGTDYRFVDYLKAMKEIEAIEDRRIKSAQAKGELVSRDLIKKGIIDPVDIAYRKMLTDGAKTIARRAAAMVEAGRDVADLEKFVADQISSFIKPAKAAMKRALKDE